MKKERILHSYSMYFLDREISTFPIIFSKISMKMDNVYKVEMKTTIYSILYKESINPLLDPIYLEFSL